MNKQLIVIGTAVLLLVVGLSGCDEIGNIEEDRFVGTWKSDSSSAVWDLGKILTFYSDGTASCNQMKIFWEVKDGKLIIEIPQAEVKSNYNYQFSDNDITLEITNLILEKTYIYNKQ